MSINHLPPRALHYSAGNTTTPLEGCGNTAELQQQITTFRAQLAAAESRAERYRHLIADLKHWDMSQFMTIPHPLRERMQAALSEGDAG